MPALDPRVPVTARVVCCDNDPIVPAHAAAQPHSTPDGAMEHPQADGWGARRLFGCAAAPTAPTLLRVQVRRQWILPSQVIATPRSAGPAPADRSRPPAHSRPPGAKVYVTAADPDL
ncbi:hypothetical protein ACIBJF_03525 [Streptomyces sp. NPDC050743]|uniref:hypothetical protein n=1 Tax=Streptomyces sp. NPDC050743 TaxID=3365634 RepID=UPI0037B8D4E1